VIDSTADGRTLALRYQGRTWSGDVILHAYLVGQLDLLRVECTKCARKPLQRPQAHREIRPQGKHGEMEGTA
jgi:hypothetical protein